MKISYVVISLLAVTLPILLAGKERCMQLYRKAVFFVGGAAATAILLSALSFSRANAVMTTDAEVIGTLGRLTMRMLSFAEDVMDDIALVLVMLFAAMMLAMLVMWLTDRKRG